MHQLQENRVYHVDHLDVSATPEPLAYADANRAAIDANWRREYEANPSLFDGEFYLAPKIDLKDQRFSAQFNRTSFATLMYWRRDPQTEKPWHIFGVGVIVSREGYLIAGRMAAWNAAAGRVYFPAGSIDDNDIRGGMVDYVANMHREVREETGLELAHANAEHGFNLVTAQGSIALFKRHYFDVPAVELVKQIEDFISKQVQPELAEIIPVRGAGQMGDATPSYVKAFADWHFNQN